MIDQFDEHFFRDMAVMVGAGNPGLDEKCLQ